MAGRGRGKALTRPAWMDTPLPAAPQQTASKSSNKPVTDWARATASDGRPYWYSLSTGKTSWTDPAAAVWREHKTPDGRQYYYNEATKVTQWERPPCLQPVSGDVEALPEGWVAHKAPDGRQYYHHKTSGETRWERPTGENTSAKRPNELKRPAAEVQDEWKVHNTADGRTYYYNSVTRETSWTKPPGVSDAKRPRTSSPVGDLRQKISRPAQVKEKKADVVVRRPRDDEGKTLTDRQAEKYFLKRAKTRGAEEADMSMVENANAESLFLELLKEKGISEKSSWLETMARCSHDPRYTALKPYGARKHAWHKAKQKASKNSHRAKVMTSRMRDESFLEAMEELFVNESFSATTLERCSSESVKRFQSDQRFQAVDERKRPALIESFLTVRSRQGIRQRALKRKEYMTKMRNELEKMIDPSLTLTGSGNTRMTDKDSEDVKLNGERRSQTANGKPYFTDRTPFRELEHFLLKLPGSEVVNESDRATIIRDWRRHLDKLAHEKRNREREARKALRKERRAAFRSGVEKMMLDGRIPFSPHWKDVSEDVMRESFAMREEDLDARPSDLFHDGVDLFHERVQKHHDEFKRLLKESKVEIQGRTTLDELRKVKALNEFFSHMREPIAEALLADRKRRESKRRQRELQRATEDFDALLRRYTSAMGLKASSEPGAIIDGVKERSAYKQILALGGEDLVVQCCKDFLKRLKEKEQREADKNRLKRKHDNPNAPIPFDYEALAALERAKRIRLPGLPVPQVPQMPVRAPPPPPPVRVEEESGWAAAVSSRPVSEKEQQEERERRRRELLGMTSDGQIHVNGQTDSKDPKNN
eukprot:GFKZ01004489.1.p1 GENE.GFKZ01004489.1~~GFKZ01004489.1.p1  ORF type:complete len:823 (+),score=110.34 GFKZ01004489.1:153-2621(+)